MSRQLYVSQNFGLQVLYEVVFREVFKKLRYHGSYDMISELHIKQLKNGKFLVEFVDSITGFSVSRTMKCKDKDVERLYAAIFGAFGFSRAANFTHFNQIEVEHYQGYSYKVTYSNWAANGSIQIDYNKDEADIRRVTWLTPTSCNRALLSVELSKQVESLNVGPLKQACNGGYRCVKFYGSSKPELKLYLGITNVENKFSPYEDFSLAEFKRSQPDYILNSCWFNGIL